MDHQGQSTCKMIECLGETGWKTMVGEGGSLAWVGLLDVSDPHGALEPQEQTEATWPLTA